MALYMKVEGVTGDVTAKGHKDWIELRSFFWSTVRNIGSPKSGDKDREGQEAWVKEAHVGKDNDNASTALLRLALWGKGKKVEIHFTRTGDDKKEVAYLKYELDDVLFTEYQVVSKDWRPMEELGLNFTKMTVHNYDSTDTNAEGNPDRLTYDVATGVGS